MICPNCESEIDDTVDICPLCHYSIADYIDKERKIVVGCFGCLGLTVLFVLLQYLAFFLR